MIGPIAIVGMACEYPDARSPAELWENALAHRQAFRRLPPDRLRAEDYYSPDRDAPDRTYAVEAALIEGFEFDRVGFRVAASTFRSADQAHWLALDVASRALVDAGFGQGEGLPRESSGVFLGNTLTGEFSRADGLRLRWPYVRRVLDQGLRDEGWMPEKRRAFLGRLEADYKAPFPPVGEETLAGGLSNTIAGRICNQFDLKGGGYTVDGACASSLLAVSEACAALTSGDLDVALAGGVDLSLDPFELVGFAKAGALATDAMRPYDARSGGFWPGEGCGFVVLMRLDDAIDQGRRGDVVIRGWGISSDGRGGITRPEVEGQLVALRRAYKRAGFGIETVAYFEGHGTGTAVGDATELRAIGRARREASPEAPPAVIGTIKANIGHTKAAAGIAGLLKAAMAVRSQILPPATGCDVPHPEFLGDRPALRVLREGEPWPIDRPLRAGVGAMGFGGINAHVVLEGTATATERRSGLSPRERGLMASAQDAELFLLAADDPHAMADRVDQLRAIALRLSRSELTDLAARLGRGTLPGRVRAAVVASRPSELGDRLGRLRGWLSEGVAARIDARAGVFLGIGPANPRIGFLFPGQGSPDRPDGGLLRRRFEAARAVFDRAGLPSPEDDLPAGRVQSAIVAASMAALRVLEQLGIGAEVAIGQSLGELTALQWAGALDEAALLRVAAARGKAFEGLVGGAMASIAAGPGEVESLRDGDSVVVAGRNAPGQTVISGSEEAVSRFLTRARARGLGATRLPVPHAFHSPRVASAAPILADALALEAFQPTRRAVFSTVTGSRLAPEDDLRSLLRRQVTAPVRFLEAVTGAAGSVDLWIEVGPGRILTGLVAGPGMAPAVAVDAGGPSIIGLLSAAGAAFAIGAAVAPEILFQGRVIRPFDPDRSPRFFANPCERAPLPEEGEAARAARVDPPSTPNPSPPPPPPPSPRVTTALELVRSLVALRSDLPMASVKEDDRLLGDLHLSSIAVGQLIAEACRGLDLPPPIAATSYADASVAEVARALDDLVKTGGPAPSRRAGTDRSPAGVDGWVRPFTVELVDRPRPRHREPPGPGRWDVFGPPGHPLLGRLDRAIGRIGPGSGVAVCLPKGADDRSIGLLLEGAQAALRAGPGSRFVLVQDGGGGASIARSLHLEAPGIATIVVDLPIDHPDAVDWVVAEAAAEDGYAEAHYDAEGRRREPFLRLLPILAIPESPVLGPTDVVLVSGGGKGIAAESAMALARESGCRLALLGRSRSDLDAGLASNLERFEAAGIGFRYRSADVTDPGEVVAAVRRAERELGPITALIHGAGSNTPRLLADLDAAAFARTVAPKVRGAENLLAAVDADRLRLFLSFGSIIARTGMRGAADYAAANEWLTGLTERFAARHPSCRCLAVEWSVWSGIGMGERLGRVEALAREGITPIPPDQGLAILRDLIARPLPAVSVAVTGRFGSAPTLRPEPAELPFLRFLERPRIFFPGVELVVDAELSAAADPYLDDHVLRGDRLFPAVLGLEAMAQAARALAPGPGPMAFEDVRFDRPVSVPAGGATLIRLAALARAPGQVDVVLRSGSTGFQVDHFRATCRAGSGAGEPLGDRPPILPGGPPTDVPLDPDRDLYGTILFHRGRFHRVRRYRRLASTECVAEVDPPGEPADHWFGPYLPPALLLDDPGGRDAVIHAIQACIPHRTLLPIGVRQIDLGPATPDGLRLVHAREISFSDHVFTYDVDVTDGDGQVFERWTGLRLRAVEGAGFRGPWAPPLLGPYLERRVEERIPAAAISIVVTRDGSVDRRDRTRRALEAILGPPAIVRRRPDGKPEIEGGLVASSAHSGDLTMTVVGPGPLGCDLESVTPRAEALWLDLLGPDRLDLARRISVETGEDLDPAATRIWAAREALGKAGAPIDPPMVLTDPPGPDGSPVLASGPFRVATEIIRVRDTDPDRVVAIAARVGHARL